MFLNDGAGVVISTHTPLTGRDVVALNAAAHVTISTHTPLTGRDAFCFRAGCSG